MEKKLKWMWMSFLAFIVLCLPDEAICKIQAYSPSIAGQPLIFHNSKNPIHFFDRKTFRKLNKDEIKKACHVTETSVSLSENLIGLVETTFLQINPTSKQNLSIAYNQQIDLLISEIHDKFASLKGYPSKRLATLIKQTLSSFSQITNQMLNDVVDSNVLFQQDYLQMQEQVINYFISKQEIIFKDAGHNPLRVEMQSALEGLVSNMSLYISDLNSLVNGNDVGSRNVVLSRQQILQNLTLFVESSFVLEIITNRKQ